jgi:carbonic anhydrase/acetyltransferase-like protein (isoleucine patch superfamily)
MLRSYREKTPKLGERVFVDESAQVIGDVELGDDVGIWMGAVLRGDVNSIRIGARSNIQDNSVVHVDFGDELAVVVGEDVTVGHAAILHGCRIGSRCLIGMGATVLNGVRLGEECVVAAHALVAEGMEVPPRSLVMGVPARIRRQLTDAEVARLQESADHYVAFKNDYLSTDGERR